MIVQYPKTSYPHTIFLNVLELMIAELSERVVNGEDLAKIVNNYNDESTIFIDSYLPKYDTDVLVEWKDMPMMYWDKGKEDLYL